MARFVVVTPNPAVDVTYGVDRQRIGETIRVSNLRGTSHAMTVRDAAIGGALVQRLSHAVATPLVLHGSSGLSDEQFRLTILSGMTKVNISTHLNALFTAAVRESLASDPAQVDARK
jgi:fructose-bisphosphate aldolase class II